MDDNLETPSTIAKAVDERREDDEEASSGDEDEGPDWTKIPTAARPVIPKRGEKDFEPKISGGSGLQRHVLDRARSAMLDALRATRTTSSKTVSYGIWYPSIARTHVTVARGIHYSNMGHSVSRVDESIADGRQKVHKRLELLPEEALYLVERGSMFCWRQEQPIATSSPGLEDMDGVPMTVQQAFAEMIGTEDLTLEKYQVYAYLRRLGYVVTRTTPPSDAYPAAAPFLPKQTPSSPSIWQRLWQLTAKPMSLLRQLLLGKFDWWRPLRFSYWLHHNLSYPLVYASLRFLPSGFGVPLHIKSTESSSPYKLFYNLYKPSTPFKKTAPPPPDFSVVVINARTTPIPSLAELCTLFDVLPELPPPVPRRRTLLTEKPTPPPLPTPSPRADTHQSWFSRLFPWLSAPTPHPTPRKPNPFAILKAGKKMIVVAAVDAGTISFFRFGQGAFEDFPMN